MKKLFLLATAAFFITGVSFANTEKGKKKKCAKSGTCCSKTTKSCCKDKSKTAEL